MGLGLGMGIQMGPDGRFYASMGGQTMPGTNNNTYEGRDNSTLGSNLNVTSPRNDASDNISNVNNSYPGPVIVQTNLRKASM